MRISDWSSDVCSSDLLAHPRFRAAYDFLVLRQAASNEHAEEAQFWRDAQATMVEGDEAGVEPFDGEAAAEGDAEPRRRRSEARRVGKECVSTCRSRGSPVH